MTNNWPTKIPKILHLYWNGPQFTIMHYMTIQSFILYNKNWQINIYTPIKKDNYVDPTWIGTAQKYNYNGPNYFNHLKKLDVNFIEINFGKIGFFDDANDVHKSDYLRWYLLYKYGGVWSDFDILFIKEININVFNNSQMNCNINDIEIGIYYYNAEYYYDVYDVDEGILCNKKLNVDVFPIGFLISSKNHEFFRLCHENSLKYFNKDEYQCIGSLMFLSLFSSGNNILEKYKNVSILDPNTIYPYKCTEIEKIFKISSAEEIEINLKNLSISQVYGIHWYNGAQSAKELCSKPINTKENSVICKLLDKIELEKNNYNEQYSDHSYISLRNLELLEEK